MYAFAFGSVSEWICGHFGRGNRIKALTASENRLGRAVLGTAVILAYCFTSSVIKGVFLQGALLLLFNYLFNRLYDELFLLFFWNSEGGAAVCKIILF